MTWKILSTLCIALPLYTALGQADPATRDRLSEDKLEEYLNKIGQKQFAEVFQDLKDTSPHEASEAEHLLYLGKNLIRLSETARVTGDKTNAFALAEHGAGQLGGWMKENASELSSGERVNAHIIIGRIYERLLKDERQAIPFYEAAVKELAPPDWKFESVKKLESLRDSVSENNKSLTKEGAYAFKRLIFLQREQRIISDRIAAAAEVRRQRAQASTK